MKYGRGFESRSARLQIDIGVISRVKSIMRVSDRLMFQSTELLRVAVRGIQGEGAR